MTDYTDLIARLRAYTCPLHEVSVPVAEEAAAAIAALTADIAALHKRQHDVECLATERLRENVALTAERDALIHDMERAQAALSGMATENERLRMPAERAARLLTSFGLPQEIYVEAAKELRAALTSPPQKA